VGRLIKQSVVGEVLKMLTGGLTPPQLQPKWQPRAYEYLQQCLRLYQCKEQESGTESQERVDNLHKFFRVLQAPGNGDPEGFSYDDLFQGRWPHEIDTLDYTAVVVALQTLSQSEQEYLPAIRSYLCDKVKNLFIDARNLESLRDGASKLGLLIEYLADPIVLTMGELRPLVQFVRTLPEADRSRVEDIRHLAMLWQKAPEISQAEPPAIADAFVKLVRRQRPDLVNLAFDLIYLFRGAEEYCDMVVTRLSKTCIDQCKGIRDFWICGSSTAPNKAEKAANGALRELVGICERWASKIEGSIAELPRELREEISSGFSKARLDSSFVQVTITDVEGIRLWHVESELIGHICEEAFAAGAFEREEGTFVVGRLVEPFPFHCDRCGRDFDEKTDNDLCPNCLSAKISTKVGAKGVAEWRWKKRATFWQYQLFEPLGVFLFVESHFEPKEDISYESSPAARASLAFAIVRDYRSLAENLLRLTKMDVEGYVRKMCDYIVYGLVNVFPATDQPYERSWLSDVCLAGFERDTKKCTYLQVLKDVATIERIDGAKWRCALYDVCTVDSPEVKAKKYLHELLYDVIALADDSSERKERGKTRIEVEMPDKVRTVLEKCKSKEFFDPDEIDTVVDKLLRDIDTNPSFITHYWQYVNKALWLAELYPDGSTPHRAATRMSQYWVLKGTDGKKDYYRMHAKITLRLLYGSIYTEDELSRIEDDIQMLLKEDTVRCPVRLPNMDEQEVKAKKDHNFAVCRDVIDILEGYRKAVLGDR